MEFATRLQNVETSAIRELFKLLGKPGIISFAGGFPDVALLDKEGITLASEHVLKHQASAVLQYGATEGYEPFRQAVSHFMTQKGADVEPQGLICTTGSQQALDLIGKTMISPGDKVIVEAPTFLATIQCFRLYGADLVNAPIDADGVQPEALEQLIVAHRPKLVYLIPNFGNPSAAMLSLERRLKILALAVKYKVLIVEDDPYGELYFDAPPPPSLLALSEQVAGSRDCLAYCGSFSKILSPGLRVGWLVAPSELLAKAVMCKQFSDAHTSNLTQAIAAYYLSLNRMDHTLSHARAVYAQRARSMGEGLLTQLKGAVAFDAPRGGIFIWARLKEQADAAEFAQRALAQQVAFVPGAPFYATQADKSTFRLSFATADVAKIEEGIARLAKAIV